MNHEPQNKCGLDWVGLREGFVLPAEIQCGSQIAPTRIVHVKNSLTTYDPVNYFTSHPNEPAARRINGRRFTRTGTRPTKDRRVPCIPPFKVPLCRLAALYLDTRI